MVWGTFVVLFVVLQCQHHCLISKLIISMNGWLETTSFRRHYNYIYVFFIPSYGSSNSNNSNQISTAQIRYKCTCQMFEILYLLKCCTFQMFEMLYLLKPNPILTQFGGTSTICSCTIYTITICSHPNPSISQNFCTTCTRCRYLPFISNTTKLMPSFSLVSSQLRKLPHTVTAWLARARINDNTAPIRVA